MAASLKGIDPKLKFYLKVHRLPDVYESLLSGLVVMTPDDPYQFLIDKLNYLKGMGYENLHWDMFIAESMKPKKKIIGESSLDYIFNFEENMMPTPEMYEKAYNHYNQKLKRMCINALLQYHLRKKRVRKIMEKKINLAATHYTHRIYRVHLYQWIHWLKYRKGRQAMAYNKVHHVYFVSMGKIIFDAWNSVTLDAKRTREYFERLERGENMDNEDTFGQGSGEARDDISMLPKHVAVKIFSYVDLCDLARCSCVCRSWKVITQASLLWSRLDLTKIAYRVTDKIAMQLLHKCRPYLVHLNLQGCTKITKPTYQTVRECRNLQDLNMSECLTLNDDTLKQVAEGCRILLYLNVSHTNITDASLRVIGKNCSNLQYLSLAFCRKFSDRGLQYLANGKGCKKLVYLDVSGCLQLTPEGFGFLAAGCTNLETLILEELPGFDDYCTEEFANNCKGVKTISLLGSPNLTDESFKKLSNLKKLQKLKLESNQKITDNSFKLLGKACHEIKHLYMTDCVKITDAALKFLSSCKHLTVINLADCVRITDTGVRYIVESSCGPKIQELNLSNCVRVGDIALVSIHKRCHSLAYLSVCFCEHISEAGIELLGQTNSLTSLDISGCNCGDQGLSALGNNTRFRDVTLSECAAITDLGMQKFSQQCTGLQRLDLSHCQHVTDGAIKNLAFCCRMLNSLNLAGCKLLTDLSIQYLSGVCQYLIYLDMSGCLHITDKGLKYLRKGCKKLQTLVIMYCRAITKHASNKMLKHVRFVEYNNDEVPSYFNY